MLLYHSAELSCCMEQGHIWLEILHVLVCIPCNIMQVTSIVYFTTLNEYFVILVDYYTDRKYVTIGNQGVHVVTYNICVLSGKNYILQISRNV